jgi:hypothetical protein
MTTKLLTLFLPRVVFSCVPSEQNWNGRRLVNELCNGLNNAASTTQQGSSKAIAETLRTVSAELGDEHCRSFANWSYRFIQSGTRPSNCSSQPIENGTQVEVFPDSRLSVLEQFAGRGNLDTVVPENATAEIVDVATTLAPQLKLATSPIMQTFSTPTPTLMRREGGVKIIADSVHREPGDDAAAVASSSAAAPTTALEPKLLLRRESTDVVSFKEHLDLLMNVLRSAALILFLFSACNSLGVGFLKLMTSSGSGSGSFVSSEEDEGLSVVDAAEDLVTSSSNEQQQHLETAEATWARDLST